jgi:hypothetical protein
MENEKNHVDASTSGSNSNNDKSWSKVITDRTSDLISYDSNTSQPSMNSIYYSTYRGNNTCEKSYDDPNLHSRLTPRAADNNRPSRDPFHEFGQRKSTTEEFNISLKKYCSQQTAGKILAWATYHVSQGDDDILEKTLTIFRRIDRRELYSGNTSYR